MAPSGETTSDPANRGRLEIDRCSARVATDPRTRHARLARPMPGASGRGRSPGFPDQTSPHIPVAWNTPRSRIRATISTGRHNLGTSDPLASSEPSFPLSSDGLSRLRHISGSGAAAARVRGQRIRHGGVSFVPPLCAEPGRASGKTPAPSALLAQHSGDATNRFTTPAGIAESRGPRARATADARL